MLLKRFGSPLINWIGGLPIADLVVFVKYQEPLMAFCIAILGGIGFSQVFMRRDGGLFFFAASTVIALFLFGTVAWCWQLLQANGETAFIFYSSMIAGEIVILGAVFIFSLSPRYPRARWLRWSFLVLLSAELFLNYVYPNFYLLNALPSAQSYDPYAGAPYARFLRQHQTEFYRVFARDGILFPNWAGAFDLMDVRGLDAMYYRPYIKFIRSFLLRPGDESRINGDLADRFTGFGNGYHYAFDSDQEQRFLTLSSIKYVICATKLAATGDGAAAAQWPFQKVYDKEVLIYEFSRSLPRAALFKAAEILPDDVVLDRLKNPSFNPLERVIISKQSVPEEAKAALASFTAGSGRSTAARIVSYDFEPCSY